MLPCPNNTQNIIKYVRWFFFFRLEYVNASQIRVLEPFVIIVVMKPWKVAHSSCSSPLSCCQGGSRALRKVCFPTKRHLFVAKLSLKCSSHSMLVKALSTCPTTMQTNVPATVVCNVSRFLVPNYMKKKIYHGVAAAQGDKWGMQLFGWVCPVTDATLHGLAHPGYAHFPNIWACALPTLGNILYAPISAPTSLELLLYLSYLPFCCQTVYTAQGFLAQLGTH